MRAPEPIDGVLRDLLTQIKAADVAASEAEQALRTLEMKNGQACANVAVGGRVVAVTMLGNDYQPKPVPGLQALRAAAIACQHDHLLACRSRAEGLRWKFVQTAKRL